MVQMEPGGFPKEHYFQISPHELCVDLWVAGPCGHLKVNSRVSVNYARSPLYSWSHDPGLVADMGNPWLHPKNIIYIIFTMFQFHELFPPQKNDARLCTWLFAGHRRWSFPPWRPTLQTAHTVHLFLWRGRERKKSDGGTDTKYKIKIFGYAQIWFNRSAVRRETL